MATEEWIHRAMLQNKTYDDLPARVRSLISVADWKARCTLFCIDMGNQWAGSLASGACGEQEYYEDLLRQGHCTMHDAMLTTGKHRASCLVAQQKRAVQIWACTKFMQLRLCPCRYYRQHHRIFPYHLGHYICRVLRVSPFKYYSDLCYSSLAAEMSFSELPNFTVSACHADYPHMQLPTLAS